MAANFGIRFFSTGYGKVNREMESIPNKARAMKTGFMRLGQTAGGALGGITKAVFSLKTAIAGLVAGYGLKRLASGFIDTASRMDQMKISLDTLTKGEGERWFRKLNEWAMKMPINTEAAINSFRLLRAMGLKPTIDQMTILVDTTSAMGGGKDVIEGIARALGQMQAKGRVASEELMQLAERGIPAMEILKEKLGLTGKDLEDLGKTGVTASQAIAALFEGMAERFGGQSAKIQNKWKGLTETLKSYWTEFKRAVMDFGPMRALETILGTLVRKMDELKEAGRFDVFAKKVGADVVDVIANVIEAIGWLPTAFFSVIEAVSKLTAFIVAMGQSAVLAAAAIRTSVTMMTDPALAGKALLRGWKEAYPGMAKVYDELDRLGGSLYQSGVDAGKTAQKYAGFGVAAENLAAKIRKMKLAVEPGAPAAPREPGVPAAPIVPEVVTEGYEEKLKALEDMRANLTQKVKELTLEELDYKRWALNEEVAALLDKYDSDREMCDLISQYHKAMNEQIEGEYDEHLGRLQDANEAAMDAYRKMKKEQYQEWLKENQAMVYGVKSALDAITDTWESAADNWKKITLSAAQGMQDGFSTFFWDVMRNEIKDWEDYFKMAIHAIERALADMAALYFVTGMAKWIGGWFAPAAPAPVTFAAHSGGVLGMSSFPTRSVPASVFAGARRVHGGLRSGEIPFIGEEGELVLSRAQVQTIREAPLEAPNVEINLINQSSQRLDARQQGTPRWDAGRWVIDVAVEDLRRGGPLRDMIRSTM